MPAWASRNEVIAPDNPAPMTRTSDSSLAVISRSGETP